MLRIFVRCASVAAGTACYFFGGAFFPCDRALLALVGPRVRMRPLTSDRQAATVPKPAVAPDVHESLDVHGALSTEGTFDLVVTLDLTTETVHVVVIEVLSAAIRIDATRVDNLLGARWTDTVDVRKCDLDPLTPREIYTSDTCHILLLVLERRNVSQPWRCLCLGFREQITRTTPLRRMTLQCSQIGLTLLRTFTSILQIRL